MENKIQNLINEHCDSIYHYINEEILKNIGIMNYDYFKKNINDLNIDAVDINMTPYLLLTSLEGKGKMDYTSLRTDTIDFSQINKEAMTYYNYVQFSLNDDIFSIELKQTKIGGMPIDKDIVKFSKEVRFKSSGLEKFILQAQSEK